MRPKHSVHLLFALAFAFGAVYLTSNLSQAQTGPPKSYVSLQPTTPGSSQSGHANISGTFRANRVFGSSGGFHTIDGATNNSTDASAGVYGSNASVGGFNFGVHGVHTGPTGGGVAGESTSATATGIGVFGRAYGNFATGVGAANPTLGVNTELAGPRGGVWTNGHMYRQYAASARFACSPIAYGTVAPDGTIEGGTGNFTVQRTANGVYKIEIDGEPYDYRICSAQVTNISTTGLDSTVAQGQSGELFVYIRTSTATVDGYFSFLVFKNEPSTPNDH